MSHQRLRLAVGVAALAALLVSAGCAQVTVRADVGPDGTLDEYQFNFTTSDQLLSLLNSSARENGYDSFPQQLAANVSNSTGADETSVKTKRVMNGNVSVIVTATDPEADAAENITVSKEGDNVTYRDRSFASESEGTTANGTGFGGSLTPSLDYYVTMPGEVRSTNADFVNGTTAHWHAEGTTESLGLVRVTSSSGSESGSAPAPGFTAGTLALAAVLALVVAAVRRRRGG